MIHDEFENYEPILIKSLQEAYQIFLKHVEIKEQSRCEDYLKRQIDNIEHKLRKGEFESMIVFNNTIKVIQNEFFAKFPNFPQQVSTNLWRASTERIVYKAGEYISRAIHDKAKNESLILKNQISSLQQSYDKIVSEYEQERMKKAMDIREVEKKNATLKSTMKMIEEKFILTERNKEEEIKKIKQEMAEKQVCFYYKMYRNGMNKNTMNLKLNMTNFIMKILSLNKEKKINECMLAIII